jgi:hypothetical protein
VNVGVIAIDGTKMAPQRQRDRTMHKDEIAHTIAEEAVAADAAASPGSVIVTATSLGRRSSADAWGAIRGSN